MQPSTPLIDRLAEQEPKRTALLLKIMERPAMYFGTPRFDYFQQFFGGYDWDAWERRLEEKTPRPIDETRELEYWLLHTHSATFHGSLTARSLFYRCFGCGPEAFEAYRSFLHTSLPQSDSVDYDLYKYQSDHKIPYYDGYDKPKPEILQQMAQTVLDNITELLHRSEITYDQLKIYVRRDYAFLQLRFLYHSEAGWTDDSALLASPENHDLLIAIHAYAQNTSTKALQNCGFDVLDTRRRKDRFGHDRPYAQSFAYDYAKWKTEISHHLPPT